MAQVNAGSAQVAAGSSWNCQESAGPGAEVVQFEGFTEQEGSEPARLAPDPVRPYPFSV